HLVGLTVESARALARDAGLKLAAEDPDGPPLVAFTWPGVWMVTAQRPAPGSVLHRKGTVVVDFEPGTPGEGAGVREPRRPLPQPDASSGDLAPAESDSIDSGDLHIGHRRDNASGG